MSQSLISISISELCQRQGIENHSLVSIVEYGIVEPIQGDDESNWLFDTSSIHWIEKALRLQQDLEIDWIAVALVIDLMQQKESLERENRRYQQQLERFIQA